MKIKGFLLILFLLASGCATTTEIDPDANKSFVGSYTGQVYDGGSFTPVTTTFSLSTDGQLSGSYALQTQAGVEQGSLTNVQRESDYSLSMHWDDKYGNGLLRVLFSEDFNAFMGFWGGENTPVAFPWGGERETP